jgi:hypothetical protein
MTRRLKFSEPTDVVSVRLPISLIDRLDTLCDAMRIGRADFIAAVLTHYPRMPSPERARIWLANLAFLLIGGSTALLAAWHTGSELLSEGMSPARALSRHPLHLESGAPGLPGPVVVPPVLPPWDPRLDDGWRLGTLQGLIPRRPAGAPTEPAPDTPPADGGRTP